MNKPTPNQLLDLDPYQLELHGVEITTEFLEHYLTYHRQQARKEVADRVEDLLEYLLLRVHMTYRALQARGRHTNPTKLAEHSINSIERHEIITHIRQQYPQDQTLLSMLNYLDAVLEIPLAGDV